MLNSLNIEKDFSLASKILLAIHICFKKIFLNANLIQIKISKPADKAYWGVGVFKNKLIFFSQEKTIANRRQLKLNVSISGQDVQMVQHFHDQIINTERKVREAEKQGSF